MLTTAIFLPVVTGRYIHITTSCFRIVYGTFIGAQLADESPAVTESWSSLLYSQKSANRLYH